MLYLFIIVNNIMGIFMINNFIKIKILWVIFRAQIDPLFFKLLLTHYLLFIKIFLIDDRGFIYLSIFCVD